MIRAALETIPPGLALGVTLLLFMAAAFILGYFTGRYPRRKDRSRD